MSEHITVQTVNLVNRLVKNLKTHSSNQKVTFHPSLKFTHLQLKLAFVTQMSTIILAFLTDRLTMCLLFCDTDEWKAWMVRGLL